MGRWLYLAAGQFLRKYPVTNRSYDDDPWPNWLNREMLTRADGLWLADGIDATPLDTQINLLEEGETGLVIMGNNSRVVGNSSLIRFRNRQTLWLTADLN
jgi:hypothetical protein